MAARDISPPPNALPTILILLLGAILFFRPHEDIFGGQDGGAYLNTSARLARDPHLSYIDNLLEQVPPDVRASFLYYGFERPYLSKFACGRVKDIERAICTVWFQPAYPVVASLPGRVFGLRAIFFVVPVFGLLTAFILSVLARQLWPDIRGIGNAAAIFYIINPLTVWHVRHPRPEILASFCVLAAAVLLLRVWQQSDWRKSLPDVLLGSFCMGLAPFFHITAWMAAVPAAILVAFAILSGRRAFLIYPPIAYVCLRAFVWQLTNITDTYGLLHRAPWLAQRVPAQAAVLALAVGALAVLSPYTSSWKTRLARYSRLAGALTAVALLSGYAICWILARLHPPTKDWPPVHFYMFRTDLNAVLNMISRPAGALALAGALLLALRNTAAGVERRTIIWLLAPATMLLGNLYDFFLTRYLMVAFVPFVSLALTSLLTPLANLQERVIRLLAPLACALFAAVLIHNRTHLLRTTEYRGLTRFIEQVARPITSQNGILLFEYPRLAAPFDLMFGIPTLALHNERDDDYSRQEEAWAEILRRFPNRPAFFITPFQPPRSALFHFEPLAEPTYAGHLLVQNRWDLPTDVRPWSVTLHVYRMTLSSRKRPAPISLPDTYTFGPGNMGLRRFAQVPHKPRETDGIRIVPEAPYEMHLPSVEPATALALFVSTSGVSAINATLHAAGTSQELQARPLVNEWYLATIPAPFLEASHGPLSISVDMPVFLHDILLLTSNRCLSALQNANPEQRERIRLAPLYTRWARQSAAICVPVPAGRTAVLLVFHTAPDELSEMLTITATGPAVPENFSSDLPPGRWMWSAWPLLPSVQPYWTWITFTAQPSFDPQMRGYPSDLITHFGWGCVVEL